MRIQRTLPALVLGLALTGLAGVSPADTAKADAAKIDKLVEQLGSDTFAEREEATAALKKIGMPALGALRKGVASKDSEVRKRAKDLLGKLEKEAATAEVLTPTRVHLVYKDTPLKEALADLKKKMGAEIVLHDPAGKLKEKKVTLDTGKTTFWDALDQFCDAAGVVEGLPEPAAGVPANPGVRAVPLAPPPLKIQIIPAPAAPPARVPAKPAAPAEKKAAPCDDKSDEDKKVEEEKRAVAEAKAKAEAAAKEAAKARAVAGIRIQIGGGLVPIGPGGLAMPGMPGMPGRITLVPGKRAKVPTDASSSIRVRVGDKSKAPAVPDPKEFGLVLEVTPEPRLRWQSLVGVSIDKAIDDNGTRLKQVVPKAAPNGAGGFGGGGIVIIGGGGGVWGGGINPFGLAQLHQYVQVKLEKGDKASKSLAELSGTIAAHVQLPAEAMMTVETLTKAKGKGVKGKSGTGDLEVTSYTKAADGTVTIEFTFTQPENVTAEMQLDRPVAMPVMPPRVAPPGGALPAVMAMPMMTFAPYGLTLRDDKGNHLSSSILFKPRQIGAPGGTMNFTATYRPAKDGPAEPAKLVFTGRRTALVNIPFTLKKVPLE